MPEAHPDKPKKGPEKKQDKSRILEAFANKTLEFADAVSSKVQEISEKEWQKYFDEIKAKSDRDGTGQIYLEFIEQNKNNKEMLLKAAKYLSGMIWSAYKGELEPFTKDVLMTAIESKPGEVKFAVLDAQYEKEGERFFDKSWGEEIANFLFKNCPDLLAELLPHYADKPWAKALVFDMIPNKKCTRYLLSKLDVLNFKGGFPWVNEALKRLIDEYIDVDLKTVFKDYPRYFIENYREAGTHGDIASLMFSAMMDLKRDPTTDKKWFNKNYKRVLEYYAAADPLGFLAGVPAYLNEPQTPDLILKATKAYGYSPLGIAWKYSSHEPWGPRVYAQAKKIVETQKIAEAKEIRKRKQNQQKSIPK